MKSKLLPYHILAVVTVLIWGVTFVNSKVLLLAGLRPSEIFVLRFLLAYVCIWFISPRKLFADTWKDELWMVVLGITGGSLYFVSENVAVGITYTTNVSFIVSTNPLLLVLLSIVLGQEVKATPRLLLGSLMAVLGVAVVILNGRFVLKLNPLGDLLALVAAFIWAVYGVAIRKVQHRYSSVFITRKLFFYGLVTMFPVFIAAPWSFPLSGLLEPKVLGNLLFLGLIASFACYCTWTVVLKKVGIVKASNYLYLNPVSTVVASSIVLHEPFTWLAAVGAALILAGIYLANSRI